MVTGPAHELAGAERRQQKFGPIRPLAPLGHGSVSKGTLLRGDLLRPATADAKIEKLNNLDFLGGKSDGKSLM